MTDANSPDPTDTADTTDPTAHDRDKHSTWSTMDGTADVDEMLDEDDLENFFVEPMPDPLNPAAATDAPKMPRVSR